MLPGPPGNRGTPAYEAYDLPQKDLEKAPTAEALAGSGPFRTGACSHPSKR